jgi:muramoyltetrapeptide carboxypeptidase
MLRYIIIFRTFNVMKRKQFIAAFAPLAIGLSSKAQSLVIATNNIDNPKIKIPPYLTKGSTIGITCPAGFLTLDEAQPAIKKMEEWGYKIKLGTTIGLKSGTFAGTDAQRLADMQAMLNDNTIQAIMCGRGGYGCNRIIDNLDFTNFKKNPKWLIGFSDITLLHTHINTALQIATIHSKMCNSFLTDWSKAEPLQLDSINSINDCLQGKKMQYTAVPNAKNKLGEAQGKLVGGNLSIIYSANQTKSALQTSGCILFLEEVGEYLYSMDRMLWNLKRSGALKNLKGLIIGGMKHKPAEKPEEEFGETVQDIVLNLTKEYNYPVCFDFNVGHQKANFALKCGVQHKLIVSNDAVKLNTL